MVQFDFSGANIVRIRTHYDQKDRCAAIPGGRWVPRERAWEYLLTPATAASILQSSFNCQIKEDDRQKFQKIADRLFVAQSIRNGKHPLTNPVTNIPCWHHQLITYNMMINIFGLVDNSSIGGGYMAALDMGCGKSKVTVDLVCNYPESINAVLIVCPQPVIEVWTGNEDRIGQFEIHAVPKAFKNLIIHPVIGSKISVEKKTHSAELARYRAANLNKQFVCVVNYESAWREPFASWAMEVGFDLVVLDESHRIKSPGGVASKFFAKLAKTARCRLELTGTPLPHSPLDIYGQYRFADPGIFGTSFTKFRSQYAFIDMRTQKTGKINDQGEYEEKTHEYGVVLGYRNSEMLHDKMFLIAHRVKSADVFDLPKFQSEIRTCELSDEERKIYRQMDTQFMAEVNNGEVTAANALVKLLRLQEITSGYIDKQHIGDSKKKLLADTLEDFELQEPLVIFARFTNDLKAIKEVAEKQGRRYAELSGNANELSQWQSGKSDVLGVQIKSGREGVDFTRARYSIYYSLGFSLGDYEQSIKRVDRPGQTREGMYLHLLAKDTVDFKVMEALEKRQEVIASVLNQYKDINDIEDVPEFDDKKFGSEIEVGLHSH